MQENILGTEKLGKLLVKFAIPSIIGLIVNAIYNIVDQIFIGWGVGYLGNGATNVIFPLMTLAMSFALLLGDGTASYMSLMLGQKKEREAAKGAAAGLISSVVVCSIYAILYFIFLPQLCRLFGATDAILPYALDYGRISALGVFFCGIAGGWPSIIRADGNPRFAMGGMLLGCGLNIILDPIFIFVFHWGVQGAALATIIGQGCNCILFLFYVRRMNFVKIDRSVLRECPSAILSVAKLGISSFINQFMIVFIIAVQNNILIQYGAQSVYGSDVPIAAMGVTMKLFNILTAICIGLAIGAQPIWGYNYGSKQYDRVKRTFRYVLTCMLIIMSLAVVAFQTIPMVFVSIFGATDPLYNEFAVKCLRIALLMVPFGGVQVIGGIFFQALGHPIESSVLSVSKQVFFQIPATLILPIFLGVVGALWAGALADFLAFILAVIMLRRSWYKLFPKHAS